MMINKNHCFEHTELPAKLLDYFLRSNKSNTSIKIILYILELQRLSDRNEDFLGVKEDEANEEHKNIIEAL